MARAPGGPRTRYIAFRVDAAADVSRKELIRMIQERGRALHGPRFEEETGAWLTRYNGTHGIIRCHEPRRDDLVATLQSVRRTSNETAITLTPLATSGTVRTLIDRDVPGLKEPRDTKQGKLANARERRRKVPDREPRRG